MPAAGTYRLIVRAFGRDADLTPADNIFLGPMVTIDGTDLTLDGISAAGSAVSGGSFAPSATVRVSSASRNVKVTYVLSKDSISGNADDIPLGTATAWALGSDASGASASTAPSPAFRIPVGIATGTYRLLAIVDPHDQVAETNETNNTMVGPAITVMSPELRATLVAGSSPTLRAGASGRALLRLTNPGGATVSHTYAVRLYLSKDKALSSDDRLFSTRRISVSVGTHRTAALSLPYTLPRNAPLGTRYLIAAADVRPAKAAAAAKRRVRSLTATQFEAFARVSVVGPQLSAVVRKAKVHGGKTALTVRVSNRGNANFAGPATLRITLAAATNAAALLSVRQNLTVGAGKHQDVILVLPQAVADRLTLSVTVRPKAG
jgi:hypothetical protein